MRFLATVALIMSLGLIAMPGSSLNLLPAGPLNTAEQASAQASSPARYGAFCQCTDYVRNRFGLFSSRGWFIGAQDMGPYLEANGMVPVSHPQPGAVAVFPSWFGSGIHPWYGHVAVVQDAYWYGDSAQLVLRGANQSYRNFWSEYGCYNVSDMHHIHHSPSYPYIDYYVWPGKPWMLEPVTVSHANPQVGEKISVTFAFQNVGDLPLSIETVMAGGRKGTSWDSPVSADFSGTDSFELAPGEAYYYYGVFTPQEPGEYFVAPTIKIDGEWSEITDASYAWYTVQPAEPDDVRLAEAEPTAAPEPSAEPTAAPEPSAEPTAAPEPSAEPTAAPEPSAEPTAAPEPSAEPTAAPEPSAEPSAEPTAAPEPSAAPVAGDGDTGNEQPVSVE